LTSVIAITIDKAIGFLQTNGVFAREQASIDGIEHIYILILE